MDSNPNEKAPISSSSQLDLNPGPPSRKRVSGTKCLLGGAAFFICFIIFSFLWLITRSLYQAVYVSPHQFMYQNQTLDEVSNHSRVVRPLIDDEQTFNLAVTVWIKRSDAERQFYESQHSPLVDTIREKTEVDVISDPRWASFLQEQEKWDMTEKPVFSDVVFHGLKLSDKNIFADVNFTIPTAVFRDANLTVDYLRASVVLIPTSPSLLDHLVSYTHWLPAWSKGGPRLSYPFPLGSDNYKRRTLIDEAIDDMGIQFSLLRLVDVTSKCHADPEPDNDDEDVSNELSERERIKHPYIKTRTQLRIVDETHIFNRKAFDKVHRALKNACGQGQGNKSATNAGQCALARTYRLSGNRETRLELSIPDANADSATTEYAYAPYLSEFRHTLPVSPWDLLKVPVHRENCSGLSSLEEDRESMNITWHLSYTGRTPGKFLLADSRKSVIYQWANTSSTSDASQHDSAVLAHGLFGHWFGKEYHPRRRLLASFLFGTAGVASWILDLHYWYTCVSTVSISVSGYVMLAVAELLIIIKDEGVENSDLPFLIWAIMITAIVLKPLLILKAVGRAEVIRRYKLIPWLRFSPATHSERVSARIDAKTPASVRFGALVCLMAGWWLCTPQTVWLVSPTTAIDAESPRNLVTILATCLALTGLMSQLILNHRTRVFAGSYKTSVFLDVFRGAEDILFLVQSLFGPIAARAGISVFSLITKAVLGLMAYQALTLPSAAPTDEDEKKV